MGVSNSKVETCEPLRLCKERKKFIKQAIDSRYNLAAAHVVYIQSLQNIGIALHKFAETRVSLGSSPPQIDINAASCGNGCLAGCSPPHFPNNSTLNHMKSSEVGAVTVNLNPSKVTSNNKVYVDEVESLPPPPPRLSWDYFNPTDGSFRLMGLDRFRVNYNDPNVDEDLGGLVTPPESIKKDQKGHCDDNVIDSEVNKSLISENCQIQLCDLKGACLTEEETELITHSAKDFLSSIKDIESHFIRASKSGNEVLRMLEASKIQVSYSEAKGISCFTLIHMLIINCLINVNGLI